MKNLKRYAAILAVILLLAVFCLPMVFAFGKSENSQALFRGAMGAAMLLPILLYAFLLIYRVFGKKKEEDRAVKNIVFDVGQVLVKYDWQSFLAGFGFDKAKYERLADITFRSQTWQERDRGCLPDEEYVEQMVKSAPEYEKEIREIMRRSAETISIMDYSKTWVQYLKEQGYHIYILSNFCSYMLERTKASMGFLEYVDGAVFSCDVNQLKPEPEIYHTLLDRFGLKPEETVFLDDREENCAAAEKEGIHAIRFTSFKAAAAELEKLGVK